MNVSGIVDRIIAADSPANTLFGERVHPGLLDQEAGYPAAVVTLITPGPTHTKTQASDLDIATVQVDVYAQTYPEMADASAAARTALDQYAGTVTLTGGGTVDVALISYINETDGFVERGEIFRRICEYKISIRR